MVKEATLKPCPFCGGEAEVVDEKGCFFIICKVCRAQSANRDKCDFCDSYFCEVSRGRSCPLKAIEDTKRIVIEAWNRRWDEDDLPF